MSTPFPDGRPEGLFVGRIWRPGIGPALVTLRGDDVVDITGAAAPTMRDLLELDDPAAFVAGADGETVCTLDALADASNEGAGADSLRLLAPCDLQAVKACGVTFADSMVERVIEERAAGDASAAEAIRSRVAEVIGDSLRGLVPGSEKAAEVKRVLQAEGLWSPYLEVGIGPDAEVFTKGQPMSAVGWGAAVGLHPVSTWNNPEPEIVLAADSRGRILGATLGNDVNLRDVEGRSALLLGKAKDNNASGAIGPFLRLFDGDWGLDDVRRAELTLRVEGEDGFVLDGRSSMSRISRDPADLITQAIGRHHQYPDGLVLFLGTLFAPVQDRDAPGQGFTHKVGDVVRIREASLGELSNVVRLSTEAPEWTFGAGALMRNLAGRGLLA
ncbi:fumarylacetoacetate hydrolase family protein [Wenxinia marina]|uniref:Fumarylacetoacetate (FAA) hydrolase family protein n=1 Tax=Wenxinia marina DSM 24838 TaxID=1123501 RepID=A0A0D0NNF7_9RHOB|nr:fumarylacetoacetate hydrolase family protein [Wenxinia marina]KIQ69770.1 Fumarylacetoacetate (FAA) hydrolase family protein [Wenxinia marina DSM 24838]GGL61022.1 fumarylacetoacetate hydrolase [Wenxinia marina]